MSEPITLVLMVPSGESYITRDAAGQLRLHKFFGAGARPIDSELLYIKHGYEPVNLTFADLDALDAYMAERVSETLSTMRLPDGWERRPEGWVRVRRPTAG